MRISEIEIDPSIRTRDILIDTEYDIAVKVHNLLQLDSKNFTIPVLALMNNADRRNELEIALGIRRLVVHLGENSQPYRAISQVIWYLQDIE